MTPSRKIPATVITGFLGAGKTTLIRHVINHAAGKRIALIINEFGDVGVDADILKGCGDEACAEADMVELANGCICCTVAEDFIPTITALLEREDRPDHIVIETSGLALPQPLVRAFNWPEISAEVTVDGVITVADAAALADGRFAGDEAAVDAQRQADEMLDHDTPLGELFEDQLICADMVLLNKTDLVDEDRLNAVEADLKTHLRDGVTLVRTSKGVIDMAALLGVEAGSEADMDTRASHHEREHGHHDHDHDDFDSFTLRLPAEADREAAIARLTEVIKRFDILRLKGFIALEGAGARLAVQAVGPRIEAYFDRPWAADEARESSLVVIGQSPLDRAAITEALRLGELAA
jgi:cobalamin biosynthesis protein CobW